MSWRSPAAQGVSRRLTWPFADTQRYTVTVPVASCACAGVVASMPINQLLLETDAPDQPDADQRGRRNEPALLPRVLAAVAELRGEPPEAVAAATTANAERLFSLPVSA